MNSHWGSIVLEELSPQKRAGLGGKTIYTAISITAPVPDGPSLGYHFAGGWHPSLVFFTIRNFKGMLLVFSREGILSTETEPKTRQTLWACLIYVTALFQGSLPHFSHISQVPVLTTCLVLLATLFMTLINLVLTVCEHLLWARFPAKPFMGHNFI